MSSRGSRAGWMIAIPALMLAVWLVGVSVVAWRGLGRSKSWIGNRLVRTITGGDQQPAEADADTSLAGPSRLEDPRLSSLRQAAASWRRSTGPERLVVDQVCLVPDVATFFEAIAAWDERHFFPILIDEPTWTLPFLRAFRPARVVRYVRRARQTAPRVETGSMSPPASRDAEWSQALEAVARAWSGPSESDLMLPVAGLSPPRGLGATPPGLVLSAPQAPMLAGAVALAAGHFQPLVRLRLSTAGPSTQGGSVRPPRFGDVLTLAQAWQFARGVEARVASVITRYDQLGDDCDFLTLAGEWPFRYSSEVGDGPIRGLYSLDDLIGRTLQAGSNGAWLDQNRRRWAYTGRLLGDPAASAARAMEALFLHPTSALLWNTYSGKKPWSDYTMGPAAADLGSAILGAGAVVHRSGRQADLANWHTVVDPVNRFGLVLMNSSGAPDMFAISGGAGRPSDLPRGVPAAVAMLHSFSAADPTDPQTIAGRWLAQGAFVYFGALNEPFLRAFRPPRLVAELMAAEVPFVAALRQGEFEPFGFPWRLVYLGDPLYRLENEAITPDGSVRIAPSEWRKIAPDYAGWPVAEIAARVAGSIRPPERGAFDSEDHRFRWCLDAAIADLVGPPSDGLPSRSVDSLGAPPSALRQADWLGVLTKIRRDRLDCGLRPFFDDLLIDALEEVGTCEELMTRLAQVPPAECGPRVWQALESCGMARLARLARDRGKAGSFGGALDLWDQVMRLNWPQGSHFPAQFTERVAALTVGDAQRSRLWLDRLRRAGDVMAAEPGRYPHAAVVAAERARIEPQLGGLGSSR